MEAMIDDVIRIKKIAMAILSLLYELNTIDLQINLPIFHSLFRCRGKANLSMFC